MRAAGAAAAVLLLGGCMMAPMGAMMMGGGGHGGQEESGGHGAGHASRVRTEFAGRASAAEQMLLKYCTSPLAAAIVSEDAAETPPAVRERHARLGIPPFARTALRLIEASGCFRVLDADPLLFALPGAVQPELLLRARVVTLELAERPAPERAWQAVRRRAARYLGDEGLEPETLRSAEVGLALVCPRERRVARNFSGRSAPAPQAGGGSEGDVAAMNHERVALAYAAALTDAVAFLRAGSQPCGRAVP